MALTAFDTALSTAEIASQLQPGDLVTVDGYGGFAEIQKVYEDGVGPHGHLKYRALVVWGPQSSVPGRSKQAKTGAIDDFPVGRLRPAAISDQQADDATENRLDDMDEAALLARMAQLKAQLQNA